MGKPKGDDRVIVNVEVSGATRAELGAFLDRRGMKKNALIAKLLTWFLAQPPAVRSVVVGELDEGMEEAYAAALEAMAAQARGKPKYAGRFMPPPESSASAPSAPEPSHPQSTGAGHARGRSGPAR